MVDQAEHVVGHFSFSQLSAWSRCGEAYRLRYVEKVDGEPSGAAIGGNAVHSVIALAEQGGWWADVEALQRSFVEEFTRRIEEVGGREAVRWGGRKTREFPQGEDLQWWLHQGPVMLKRYAATRAADEEMGVRLLSSDVERRIAAHLEVDGRDPVLVVGYVDALVLVTSDGEAVVRDYKTGSGTPEPLQLATYAWLLRNMEPPTTVSVGEFVKLRPASPERRVERHDLEAMVRLVPRMLVEAIQGIEKGVFPMKPSPFCSACSVRAECAWGQLLE